RAGARAGAAPRAARDRRGAPGHGRRRFRGLRIAQPAGNRSPRRAARPARPLHRPRRSGAAARFRWAGRGGHREVHRLRAGAGLKRLALALALAGPGVALATSVLVMSITGTGVAVLVDNSAGRPLRPGETSTVRVKLIALGSGAALIEVDGRRWLMPLGSSTASSLVLQ